MSSVFRSQSQNTKIFGCCQHVGTNRHSAFEQTPVVQGYIDHARIARGKCPDAVCTLSHENASKDKKQKNDKVTIPARSIMCSCMHWARARSPLRGNLTAHFYRWTRRKYNDIRDRPIAALSFGIARLITPVHMIAVGSNNTRSALFRSVVTDIQLRFMIFVWSSDVCQSMVISRLSDFSAPSRHAIPRAASVMHLSLRPLSHDTLTRSQRSRNAFGGAERIMWIRSEYTMVHRAVFAVGVF